MASNRHDDVGADNPQCIAAVELEVQDFATDDDLLVDRLVAGVDFDQEVSVELDGIARHGDVDGCAQAPGQTSIGDQEGALAVRDTNDGISTGTE